MWYPWLCFGGGLWFSAWVGFIPCKISLAGLKTTSNAGKIFVPKVLKSLVPAAGQWPQQLLVPPFAWLLLLSHLLMCFPMPGTWSWRPEVTDICLFCFFFSPHSTDAGDSPVGTTTTTNLEQPQVIPSQGDLLGDLLNLDLGPPVNVPQVPMCNVQMGAVDLLGGGLDSLVSSTSSLAGGR